MLYGIIVILFCCIGFLCYKLNQKQILDTGKKQALQNKIEQLQVKEQELDNNLTKKRQLIEGYQQKLTELHEKQSELLKNKTMDLDVYFAKRQEELNANFEQLKKEKEDLLAKTTQELEREYAQQAQLAETALQEIINECNARASEIQVQTQQQEEKFNALLSAMTQYEQEKQARLYYTIQVPDEYKEDIQFLVTEVSQKVTHPDVINRLVWAEYVKPYIDDTLKRANIKDEPGIYKITNIDDNKCYIGKSTNIKKRIIDHFKSSIGISTIADQAVHHAIWKTGFWNWAIEPIMYCDKDKLSEMEKYYIEFFKAQEYGYNKTSGG